MPGHEDRRRQGAVGARPALNQPGASGAEDGRNEPVAQRLCTRRLLPPPMRVDGQTQRQYGHGSQARPNGLLHAHTGLGVCRPRAGEVRATVTSTQCCQTQTLRQRGLRHRADGFCHIKPSSMHTFLKRRNLGRKVAVRGPSDEAPVSHRLVSPLRKLHH